MSIANLKRTISREYHIVKQAEERTAREQRSEFRIAYSTGQSIVACNREGPIGEYGGGLTEWDGTRRQLEQILDELIKDPPSDLKGGNVRNLAIEGRVDLYASPAHRAGTCSEFASYEYGVGEYFEAEVWNREKGWLF